MNDLRELQTLLEREREKRRAVEAQLESRTRELQRSYLQLEKANITLATQSRFAEAIVSAVPMALLVLDGDYRVVTVNPPLALMFGMPEHELIGRPASTFLRDDLLSLVRGSVELNRPLKGLDLALMLPSCEQLFVRVFIDQLKLEEDSDRRILVLLDDITGRKRAEAALRDSEGKFRGVVEHAGDALFVYDDERRLIDINQAASESLGLSRDQLLTRQGKNIGLVCEPRPEWYQLDDGDVMTLEGEHRHRDGTVFPVEARIGCFSWRRRRHLLALVRDITERKQAEATLQALNDQLTIAMNRAIEASAAKSEFLANMSHELRTPLNAIIGYTELLQEEAPDYEADDLLPDLDRIHVAATHLLGVINDILDLSKIEAGKVELFWEETTIENLLSDVAITIRPLAERKNNVYRVETDAFVGTINADIAKLRQCLINLLGNACKFTDKGTITLRTTREPGLNGGDIMVFEVTDTGIGVTAEKLGTLFEAFTQADGSITRRYGGTGLGLAITKHFCSMMGGTIEAESAPGEGSTFRIRLPARTELGGPNGLSAPEAVVQPAKVTQQLRIKGRVLVIDDDPATQRLLQHHLAEASYLVRVAGNGRDGIDIARSFRPDAITLDVMMPGMDGWAVLAELKEDPALANTPVILITLVDNRQRGYALGASEYVVKPVQRHHLLGVLARTLGHDEPRGRVLIVDDEADVRDVTSRILQREGWVTEVAVNGIDALARMRLNAPDIVLLDLMMPELDGFGVLEAMKLEADLANVPVVVITAKELDDDQRLRLHQSVEKVLHKASQSQNAILDAVRRVIGQLTDLPPADTTPPANPQ